jgi:hypothetical protein
MDRVCREEYRGGIQPEGLYIWIQRYRNERKERGCRHQGDANSKEERLLLRRRSDGRSVGRVTVRSASLSPHHLVVLGLLSLLGRHGVGFVPRRGTGGRSVSGRVGVSLVRGRRGVDAVVLFGGCVEGAREGRQETKRG